MAVIDAATARTGLCATCNNSATCVYRSKRGFDALYCEMFESRFSSGSELSDRSSARSAEATVTEQVASAPKGLCVNCANRDKCTLCRPDEGVWHCEEYC